MFFNSGTQFFFKIFNPGRYLLPNAPVAGVIGYHSKVLIVAGNQENHIVAFADAFEIEINAVYCFSKIVHV